ncbi:MULTISPECIES: TetR/AcrR family transcriptional regulator [Azospirillum]|uniref:TetR/AcrR family transcriptional regulator n=4 Tax=Azospirillum TaxID=191 RepID=A0A4D8QIC1_AZOBR|nr:TetR/AcrR family transcriptional regulator [Azospirillum argentinense]QCN98625.1 TetR/AcrR family transcriptional regulator [Azospirillum argentinense]QCO05492.1 TetR/AcrR family transcriptional regulator [Azospirillum argentinense]
MEAKTLNRESWLSAAFSALAEGGVEQVRVELLAKRLKVTKGSFYWHFRDRMELVEAMLEGWKTGRIEAIKAQTRLDGRTPAEGLRYVLSLYGGSSNPRGIAIELAMRDWARRDPRASEIVAEVDRERLRCVSDLFAGLGLDPDDAFARAYLFYSFIFGEGLLARSAAPDRFEKARDICGKVLVPEGVV